MTDALSNCSIFPNDAFPESEHIELPLGRTALQSLAIELHAQVVKQYTVFLWILSVVQMGNTWTFSDGVLLAKNTAVVLSHCGVHDHIVQQPKAIL